METISSRSGFVAKVQLLVFRRKPLHDAAHAFFGRIDFTEKSNLSVSASLGDRHGVAELRHIDSHHVHDDLRIG